MFSKFTNDTKASFKLGKQEFNNIVGALGDEKISLLADPNKIKNIKDVGDLKNQARAVYAAQAHNNSPVYVRMHNVQASGPAFEEEIAGLIKIYTEGSTEFTDNKNIGYIRIPNKVIWDYVVVNEKALYNATNASDFDLHPSEETNLVYRILMLSGITINKPGLASLAKAEVVEQGNNEKA